jgi:hypothetical protein
LLPVAVMAAVIVLWSAFSAPLDRRRATSALAFAAGLVLGSAVLEVLRATTENSVAARLSGTDGSV